MALVAFRRAPHFVVDDTAGHDDGQRWDPYFILGLPVDNRPVEVSLRCPYRTAEIHTAFLELSKHLHPDRRHRRKPKGQFLPYIPLDVQYDAVAAAYKLLKDMYMRARYHLSKDIDNPELYAIMAEAKEARAVHEVHHMQVQYDECVAEQEAKKGLVVVRALYGEAKDIRATMPLAFQDVGEAIDVTVPVQILVQRSVSDKTGREVMKIELSDVSKVHLDGFYDPLAGYAKQLLVRYKYRDNLHQVVVGDREKLRIPLASHLIPLDGDENVAQWTALPASVTASVAPAVVEPLRAAFSDVTNKGASASSSRDSMDPSAALPHGKRRTSGRFVHQTHSLGRQCRRTSKGGPAVDFAGMSSELPVAAPPRQMDKPKQKGRRLRRRAAPRTVVPVVAGAGQPPPPPFGACDDFGFTPVGRGAYVPPGAGAGGPFGGQAAPAATRHYKRWVVLLAVAVGLSFAASKNDRARGAAQAATASFKQRLAMALRAVMAMASRGRAITDA